VDVKGIKYGVIEWIQVCWNKKLKQWIAYRQGIYWTLSKYQLLKTDHVRLTKYSVSVASSYGTLVQQVYFRMLSLIVRRSYEHSFSCEL
jgi:hypothetical protein